MSMSKPLILEQHDGDLFADSHLLHEVSGLVVTDAFPRGRLDSFKVIHAELSSRDDKG